jgi:glyoxylase I family protein
MTKRPSQNTGNRPRVLAAITTHLQLYALALLVLDGVILTAAISSGEPYKTYLVLAAIVATIVLVLIVTFYGQRATTAAFLHHASVPVRNLQRSLDFYIDVVGLSEDRTRDQLTFGVSGKWLWLPSGKSQVHLLQNEVGTYRRFIPSGKAGFVDADGNPLWNDIHFAIRVPDIDAARNRVTHHGIQPFSNPEVDGRYPHFYILDPDGHVIEFNTEKVRR